MAFNPASYLLGVRGGQAANPFNILSNSIQGGANAGNALMKLLYGPQMYNDQHAANTARVANLNENTRLMPIDTAVTAQNALNQMGRLSQSQSRFGQAYQMARTLQMMPPAARASWIAQNKDAFTGMLAVLANKVGQQNQTQTPQVLNASWLQQQLNIPQGAQGIPNGNMPAPAAIQQLSTPQQQNTQTSPAQQSGNSQIPFQATPQMANAVGRASQLDANNKLVTTNTRQRLEGAQIFENLQQTPEFQNAMNALQMYPGPNGKVQLASDMANNTVRFQKYNAAVHQLLPLMSGSISQMEGFAKTNEGLKVGLDFFRKGMGLFGSDPAAAKEYIDRGIALLNSEYKSIKSAAQPLYNVDINNPSASGSNKKQLPVGTSTSARIRVKDKNGNVGSIPASQWSEAKAQGYVRI